jgi:pSer/pThr/pTyr-binding forkhead associated (FHA) protein
MSEQRQPDERVREALAHFEGEWAAADRPRPLLEDYVSAASGPERTDLLRELLAVELAFRTRAGETPRVEEYQGRFPGHADLIGAVFDRPAAEAPREAQGAVPGLPLIDLQLDPAGASPATRVALRGARRRGAAGPGPPEADEPEPRPERPVARPPTARLCVLDDDGGEGEWVRLRADRTVIGRTEGDVRIPHDPLLSARHADVAREWAGNGYRWVLVDLRSTNGTFVRIGSTVLRHGAELVFGTGHYRFEAEAEGPQGPVPALVELSPAGAVNRFPLTLEEFWVGRDARRCAIARPDDALLNARHARLYRRGDRWHVENNHTLNGVWLRITEMTLGDSCQFRLGEQKFLFRSGPANSGGGGGARGLASRHFPPRVEALESRVLPSTLTWSRPVGGDWRASGPWSGGGPAPGPGDAAVISSVAGAGFISSAAGAAPPGAPPAEAAAHVAVAWIEGTAVQAPLVVGQEYKLRAGTEPAQPPVGSPLAGAFPLEVAVRAPGMDVRPDWWQQRPSGPGAAPEWLEFTLVPRERGPKRVEVEFYSRRHWLTRLVFDVEVVRNR